VARLRWALLVCVLAIAALAYTVVTRDRRLPADRAARALQAKLHTRWTFTCKREENDGTVSLADVDYRCEPNGDPNRYGYWIGTDAHRITQIMPMG
jgi:hypothetical protein